MNLQDIQTIKYLAFFLWFAETLKQTFFDIYLWQLKEYRLDRLLDYLRENGTAYFFGKTRIVKYLFFALTLILAFYSPGFTLLAFSLLYILLNIKNILRFREIKKPKLTLRSALIILSSISLLALIAAWSILHESFGLYPSLILVDLVFFAATSIFVAIFNLMFVIKKEFLISRAKDKTKEMKKLTVIGITGSFGKTSTKDFLAHILADDFGVCKTPENKNTDIGITQTILNDLDVACEIFIAEMGAYKIGEIAKACEIVRPKIGILTAIGDQHISLFGSKENLVAAKSELISALPEDGLAIINGDCGECIEIAKKSKAKVEPFAINGGRISASNVKEEIDGLSFDLKIESDIFNIKTKLFGKQNISNILAAVIAAEKLGMDSATIAKRITTLKQPPKTMMVKKNEKGIYIVDDTYSANVDGFLQALDFLQKFPRKKIVVMSPLIELGKEKEKGYKKIREKINQIADTCILFSPDRKSKELMIGAKNLIIVENGWELTSSLNQFARKDDAILFENRMPEKIEKEFGL